MCHGKYYPPKRALSVWHAHKENPYAHMIRSEVMLTVVQCT